MSDRLALALIEHIRLIDVHPKFLVVEAVPVDLARSLESHWTLDDPLLPRLAIANMNGADPFRRFGLKGSSVAALRNTSPDGLCIVICEGAELAERQSIINFRPVAPADLLRSKDRLILLSRAHRQLQSDGHMAAIREAIVTMEPSVRPSASAVAAYFDCIVAGEDPLLALPRIGAFHDSCDPADIRSDRILSNFSLAFRRFGDDVIRQDDFSRIRRRAQRVLMRDTSVARSADIFMEMLENGDHGILTAVSYDEAREILTETKRGLIAQVEEALTDYVRSRGSDEADQIPINSYLEEARLLDSDETRRPAARRLLDFDESQGGSVFEPALRRRLVALLRERRVDATVGSCPEVGIAKAIHSMDGLPDVVEFVSPLHEEDPLGPKQARDQLTLAIARMRLAPVLGLLRASGSDIDPELSGSVFRDATPNKARQWFGEACLDRNELPKLRVRIRRAQEAVEVVWSPDHDDAALLRCILEHSTETCMTFGVPGQPSARQVASAMHLEAYAVSDATRPLAQRLRQLCSDILSDGISAARLRTWVADWTEYVEEHRAFDGSVDAESLSTAGCVAGFSGNGLPPHGMSGVAPIKAEWLADYVDSAATLVSEQFDDQGDSTALADLAFDASCQGLQDVTAAHCPAFLRLHERDTPLLPTAESRIWTVFGGDAKLRNFETHARRSMEQVIRRLVRLQPEVAQHLRCLALGPGSASLMLDVAISLVGTHLDGMPVEVIELFVVGANHVEDDALRHALARADEVIGGKEGAEVRLRYFSDLTEAANVLGRHHTTMHFALFTGLTAGDRSPQIDHVDIELGEMFRNPEVLFSPRLSQRPGQEQRVVLAPPASTSAMVAWMRLANAIDDAWPRAGGRLNVPELRVRSMGSRALLRELHQIATWVATLDRYATRDSLERALGDDVAILHQERRLGSESPLGLVISQMAGGPVDRSIGRSLRHSRIVNGQDRATSLGTELRRVATQGYGVLALEAATSGTGINELVGHVVGFSMLGTESTPWPLPEGCRLLLLSLDEHAAWFMGQKRADLLAVAIDTQECGLHGAIIEVKARRTDASRAEAEALDQIKRSLRATSFAAQPVINSIASRIWLNRISEGLYATARESSIRLSTEELKAIEAFRAGSGTLEWAGLGLVLGPDLADDRRVFRQELGGDHIPIAIRSVKLDEHRLRKAVETDLRELRTTAAVERPLGGGRVRRRPESGIQREDRDQNTYVDNNDENPMAPAKNADSRQNQPRLAPESPHRSQEANSEATRGGSGDNALCPILGHDVYSGVPLEWRIVGDAALANAHVQIWGSSGAGKTQFVKMLLAQLSLAGTHFGIADFKNDYGPDSGDNFLASVAADFCDLWGRPGAPYNPLALADDEDRDSRVIEFRDAIEEATASFQRIGVRQKTAVEVALREAYDNVASEQRYPTMLDLNRHLPASVQHVLGDLTRYEIFTDGPPLGAVISDNVVFGLNRIPGNGQTTVLAGAFLLSSIALAIQSLPPVTNTIRYALVVDEAHRVARIRAIDLMVKEGRSKGLAVVLATQSPADLTDTVDTNAQTRVCFRLSDATVALQAARKLDPSDKTLPERIRTLETGEALVSIQGERPQAVRMLQHHRDQALLVTSRPS